MIANCKDTNPKDAIASNRLPMSLVPGTLAAYASLAFLEGALKYGAFNWRDKGIRVSVYLDAMHRHLEKYKSGEDCDKFTGIPHLASIVACCGIILDADLCGKAKDDRNIAPTSTLIDGLSGHVEKLKEIFAKKEAKD